MKRLHQNCKHAFSVFDELDCHNMNPKPVKKGYFENSRYIERLLEQRMDRYQKEKQERQRQAVTVKKKKKLRPRGEHKQTRNFGGLQISKSDSLNFIFGEELRTDQVVLKPEQGQSESGHMPSRSQTGSNHFENSGFDRIIATIKQKKGKRGSKKYRDIDLGSEFQMIKLGNLKQEIGAILQQDLNNLTDLHMEVQRVFRRHQLQGHSSSHLAEDLQAVLERLELLYE